MTHNSGICESKFHTQHVCKIAAITLSLVSRKLHAADDCIYKAGEKLLPRFWPGPLQSSGLCSGLSSTHWPEREALEFLPRSSSGDLWPEGKARVSACKLHLQSKCTVIARLHAHLGLHLGAHCRENKSASLYVRQYFQKNFS